MEHTMLDRLRYGSFFVADEFAIKNVCEKALVNIKKERTARVHSAVVALCEKHNKRLSFLYGFLSIFGIKKRTYTVEELEKDEALLNEINNEYAHIIIWTPLTWARLCGDEAEGTCNRLLCCSAVSKQLYVSAEEWEQVCSWVKELS